ncbi:MAG TPA: cytochrome c [Bacillales bacterium]
MKKTGSIFIAVGMAVSLSACGGGGGGSDSADSGGESTNQSNTQASAARAIFEKNCASCHGENLQGGIGPSLQNIGGEMSKQEILEQIKKGTPGKMPGGIIKGEKADKVAAWLAGMK